MCDLRKEEAEKMKGLLEGLNFDSFHLQLLLAFLGFVLSLLSLATIMQVNNVMVLLCI